jgi:hypothetical protein
MTTGTSYGPFSMLATNTTTTSRGQILFPVTMRIAPTNAAVGGSTPIVGYGTYSSFTTDRFTPYGTMFQVGGTGFLAGGGNAWYGNFDGTTYLEFTGAEL